MFEYRGYHYYRCPTCQQVSTFPFPTKQQIHTHYARKFKTGNYHLYRDYIQQYEVVYKEFVEMLRRDLADRGKTLRGKTVLDVGCFTGEFLGLMRNEGCKIIGLELQKDAVKIANKKLHGKVFAVDVMSNKFPHQHFDIVTLLGIIEHVTDPLKLIERSLHLLKKGGVLMIQTPNSGSLPASLMGKYWPPYAPVEHMHLFSHKSLELALLQLGAKDVSFMQHWKKLPVSYVYQQFQNFGPELYSALKPVRSLLLKTDLALPVYGGEMLMLAHRS